MILRCTKKLRTELRLANQGLLGSEPVPARLDEWFCDLLRIDRQKYVFCTHARTLFSIVLPQVRRSDMVHFHTMFAGTAAGSMQTEGLSSEAIESVVSMTEIQFGLTNSRSVLGSMRDLSLMYRIDVELHGDAGRLNGLLGTRLNRVPMSAIGYRYAIEALKAEVSIDRH